VSTSTLHRLARELALAFRPLEEATQSAAAFGALARDLGWNLADIPPPIQALAATAGQLQAALEPVLEDTPSPADFENLLQAVRDLVAATDDLGNAPFDPALVAVGFATEFPRQLVQYLVIEHLTRAHPRVAFALTALGVIRQRYVPAPAEAHGDHVERELVWADFSRLLSDPVQIFENVYGWRTAEFSAERVFQTVLDLMAALGWRPGLEEVEGETAGRLQEGAAVPGEVAPVGPDIVLFRKHGASGLLSGGLRLLALPGAGPKLPGLALVPYLTGELDKGFVLDPRLVLTVTSSLDLQGGIGVKLRPADLEIIQGLDDPDGASQGRGELTVSLVAGDASGDPVLLVGAADGSRLTYRALSLRGGLRVDAQQQADLYAELALERAALIISAEKGDSFLRRILPEDGLSVEFEVAVGLSRLLGFYFRGSGGLELQVPVHRALGPVELEAVTLAVKLAPGDSAVRVELGASVKAELGPLTAVVEGLGLRAVFTFPGGQGGNLGPLDLDVDFKPPTGIGLAIDGRGFQGGGLLRFEPEDHRYVGILEIEFQKIALKAIGLLTTRLPGGEPGFSLLIIITADFTPPLQLGLGFTLSAVGGLLGLNRTVRVERLRSGVQDNTLGSILFPSDIVANANRVLSDLQEVFPAQAGRFLFGPMARIGWGSPTLITADVGLVLEVPDPVRLVVLGVVRAILPDEELKLVRLQVNFLGVVDFEAGQVAFDASLYDSRLLSFPLSGDMAVRLSFGAERNLLLTVGGFHPAFEPPPMALPTLRRLTIQLLSGDNPRLRLEAYLAITSNTVQFGARLELLASAGPFNLYGFLAFDALFQFNPFHLVADVGAMLALRRGQSSIACIKLDLTLEGPTPWRARGTATFKLCWFITIKIRFDRTFGEFRDTRLDDVLVLPLLTAALGDPGNWRAEVPEESHLLVTLKETVGPGDGIVVHPVGVLTVSQKVVPLNLPIDTLGQRRPLDGNRFAIGEVRVGPRLVRTDPVTELFAPAQFFQRTDAEKLASKSFEPYEAGIRVAESETLAADHCVRREVEYELHYIDSQRSLLRQPGGVRPPAGPFGQWTAGGAIAQSPLSRARRGPSALAPDPVRVRPEGFAVVRVRDLTPLDPAAAAGDAASSEAEARRRLWRLIEADPALEGELQVVPAFEARG
jgi:hypothetical protein